MKIGKPPLVYFNFYILFSETRNFAVDKLAEIYKTIIKEFPVHSDFELPSFREGSFDFQSEPLAFHSENRYNQIHVYSDSIVFRSVKYTTWGDMKKSIIPLLISLFELLDYAKIQDVRLEYIDEFDFPMENFNLVDYFNLNLNYPGDWKINWEDFQISFSQQAKTTGLFITRMRSYTSKRSSSDLTISLISISQETVELSLSEIDILEKKMDELHDLISERFVDMLTDTTKKLILFEE